MKQVCKCFRTRRLTTSTIGCSDPGSRTRFTNCWMTLFPVSSTVLQSLYKILSCQVRLKKTPQLTLITLSWEYLEQTVLMKSASNSVNACWKVRQREVVKAMSKVRSKAAFPTNFSFLSYLSSAAFYSQRWNLTQSLQQIQPKERCEDGLGDQTDPVVNLHLWVSSLILTSISKTSSTFHHLEHPKDPLWEG